MADDAAMAYTRADAEWFLNDPMSSETYGMEIAGELSGVVGLHVHEDRDGLELGYWLNRRFHGHGFMTEAARAVVADQFSRSTETLVSGYLVGNLPSALVLTKLGFRPTKVVERLSRPIGYEMPLQRMALTQADWSLRKG